MEFFDQTVLLVGLSALMVFSTVLGFGAAYIFSIRPQILLKRRMSSIGTSEKISSVSNVGENRRQRRIQEKIQNLKVKKNNKNMLEQIRLSMIHAGFRVSMRNYIFAALLMGTASALIYLIFGLPKIGIIPIALIGAIGFPKLILKFIAAKRRKQFTVNFADALDVIVRGISSGLPVSECMNVISKEFADPLGAEFRMIKEGERLGLSLEEIMRRGLERMPTSEFKFFSIVLQIQRQTGGNLATTLSNLSGVLRARKGMKDKVGALASEAKSSAWIIGSLPFLVAGMLLLLDKEYLMLLFTTDLGNYLLYGGGVWMVLGVIVMKKMINFEV